VNKRNTGEELEDEEEAERARSREGRQSARRQNNYEGIIRVIK